MASSDSKPIPIKNTAYRVYFPISKNDGSPLTSAAGLDSEVSKDGAALTDCTNEATEIGQGLYYLDLTSTEMNADTVAVIIKSSSSGAVQQDLVLYPQEAGDIKVDMQSILATALTETSAGYLAAALKKLLDVAAPVLTAASVNQTGDVFARLGAPAGASVSADVASVKTDTGTTIPGRLPSALVGGKMDSHINDIAANAITATSIATDAVAEIQSGLSTFNAAITAVTVGTNNDKTGYGLADNAITAAKIATDAITAAKIAADAIGASELAADAVAEIQSGLSTFNAGTTSVTVGTNNDKTGYSLTTPPSTAAAIADAVWDEAISGHESAGSTGEALTTAGIAGDPWATDIDAGGYTGSEAGKYLTDIRTKALLITAENVAFSTPTDPITGDLTLVRGDDYTVSSGRALPEWSSADWSPFSLMSATSLTFKAKTRYDETAFETAATALSDTQVRVELTSAETGALTVGRAAYDFDLEAVLASGDVITLAQGQITILEDIR